MIDGTITSHTDNSYNDTVIQTMVVANVKLSNNKPSFEILGNMQTSFTTDTVSEFSNSKRLIILQN